MIVLKQISLVMPAYREEKNLFWGAKNYYDYLKKNFEKFELIIVCNNCSDKTPDIAKKFAKGRRGVIVMNFPFYTGKGGAVKRGFAKAKFDLIGFADVDNATTPKEFHKLVEKISGSNVGASIASRALKESVHAKKQPFFRRIVGIGFRFLTNLLFGLGINDTQCGAKLFKKKALMLVLPELKLDGWEFDVELLWKLKKKGFGIIEVPIVWKADEDSRVKLKSIFEMFFGLIKLRFS